MLEIENGSLFFTDNNGEKKTKAKPRKRYMAWKQETLKSKNWRDKLLPTNHNSDPCVARNERSLQGPPIFISWRLRHI